jgi:hypothetical protein
VVLNICLFSLLRVSRVNFLVLCVNVIVSFMFINNLRVHCYIVKV